MKLVSNLIHDENGATLTEYAVLLTLVTVAVIGSIDLLHEAIIVAFNISVSALVASGK